MSLDGELRRTNRNMIAFDLILGSSALLAPSQTLRVLGHDEPSDNAGSSSAAAGPSGSRSRRRISSPTGATAPEDWWALSWLRGTELATDILWSRSPAFSRPGARAGLWLAGIGNLAMTAGFAYLARAES